MKIAGDRIYGKFNDDGNHIGSDLLVLPKFVFADDWATILIMSENGSYWMARNIDPEEYRNFEGETLYTGNFMTLSLNAYNIFSSWNHYEYDIIEMGNTYKEDVYIGGVINVNDVIWLRQAIIGVEDALNDPNFCVEATDVNFSNDELGTLGDIGDVISIRQRILTGEWLDCEYPEGV